MEYKRTLSFAQKCSYFALKSGKMDTFQVEFDTLLSKDDASRFQIKTSVFQIKLETFQLNQNNFFLKEKLVYPNLITFSLKFLNSLASISAGSI